MKYQQPTGGAADDPYVGRDLASGRQGSRVPPKAVEHPQRELDHLISQMGLTPADTDLQQVRKGLQRVVQEQAWTYAPDTGTADALVVTLSPAPAALTVGTTFLFRKGTSANATATPTLNLNNLGAKTATKRDGTALAAGDLGANAPYAAWYDGTNFRLVSLVASDVSASVQSPAVRIAAPYLGFHVDAVMQSFPDNVQTLISNYANRINNLPGANYSGGVFTIQTSGYYLCTANQVGLMPTGNNYGYVIAISKVNGSNVPIFSIVAQPVTVSTASLPSSQAGSASGIAKLMAGDRIAAFFNHNQGSPQSIGISLDILFLGT
jgi:hypothetical protein